MFTIHSQPKIVYIIVFKIEWIFLQRAIKSCAINHTNNDSIRSLPFKDVSVVSSVISSVVSSWGRKHFAFDPVDGIELDWMKTQVKKLQFDGNCTQNVAILFSLV